MVFRVLYYVSDLNIFVRVSLNSFFIFYKSTISLYQLFIFINNFLSCKELFIERMKTVKFSLLFFQYKSVSK